MFSGAGKRRFQDSLNEHGDSSTKSQEISAGTSAMQHFGGWTENDIDGLVWISDPHVAYVPGTITDIKGKIASISTTSGMIEVDFEAPLKMGQARSLVVGNESSRRLLPRMISETVDDMDDLTSLHEASILNNLHNRFLLDRIYTNSGPILIALNPFCWLHLYGEDAMWKYMQAGGAKRSGKSTLPPHCFAEAQGAFDALHEENGKDQAIVICGESGSGKTETTKLILSHLAFVSEKCSQIKMKHESGKHNHDLNENIKEEEFSSYSSCDDNQPSSCHQKKVTVAEQIVESSPLLEAFGNAKTTRNFNSSRFGKFITLRFDVSSNILNSELEMAEEFRRKGKEKKISQRGVIIGAHVSSMLLESSRVVSHTVNERNYHIFYQILSCTPEKLKSFGLQWLIGHEIEAFRFLRCTYPPAPTSRKQKNNEQFHDEEHSEHDEGDDEEDFPHTLEAMGAVEITDSNIGAALRVVGAIMLLGNVNFQEDKHSASGEGAMVAVGESAELIDRVSSLLGMRESTLATPRNCTVTDRSITDGVGNTNALGRALCTRVRHLPGGEVVVGDNNVTQAEDSRDALAKALYVKLFDWIVKNVNDAIAGPGSENAGGGGGLARRSSLSVNMSPPQKTANRGVDGVRVGNIGTVGVLDIFGFEDMLVNGLEQLLINTANETLQGVFNSAIFASEQAVHIEEEVPWAEGCTTLPNNTECVNLLEGKPLGVLRLLDSTCSLGNAARDGEALVKLFSQSHGNGGSSAGGRSRTGSLDTKKTSAVPARRASINILPAKVSDPTNSETSSYCPCGFATAWRNRNGERTTDKDFAITHFAGPVIYTVEGWVNKNRDELHQHITELLMDASHQGVNLTNIESGGGGGLDPSSSGGDFLIQKTENIAINYLPPRSPNEMKSDTNSLMCQLFPQKDEEDNGGGGHQMHSTVGGKFLLQLANLRHVLTSGDARFVRCIKTNGSHLPRSVDRSSVLKQLVCGGVMAALEVRRAGFPNRVPYKEFVKEYSILLSPKEQRNWVDDEEKAVDILLSECAQEALGSRDKVLKAFRPGKTKVFLAASAGYALASARRRLLIPAVCVLQQWWQRREGNIQHSRWRRCLATHRRCQETASFENVEADAAVKTAMSQYQLKIQAAGTVMTKVIALSGFGVKNVPVPDVLLEAEDAAEVAERTIKLAINNREAALEARASQLQDLDSLSARLLVVKEVAKTLYNTYDKSAMAAVCRAADRAVHSARLLYHVPDPEFDALLPDSQDQSFTTLRHGTHYHPSNKRRSIHHHSRHSHHKRRSPRGARRLERLTARAVSRAADHISDHLTPTPSSSAAKNLQFPSKLPVGSRRSDSMGRSGSCSSMGRSGSFDSVSSQLSIDTQEEVVSPENNNTDSIEGLLKISAAKTAGRVWRGKAQVTHASTLTPRNGGVILIAAATVKVEEAEVMAERCERANNKLEAAILQYEPELESIVNKIELEFVPMVNNMIGSRGFSQEFVDFQLKVARDAIEEAKDSVFKVTPNSYLSHCEEARLKVEHVGAELLKAQQKAEASDRVDEAIHRLKVCREKATSSDMGMSSAIEQSPALRQLLEIAEKEAQLPVLLQKEDPVIGEEVGRVLDQWAQTLATSVSDCEELLEAELKRLKVDRLSRFDNIKKAFEKTPSPEQPKKPSRRASSYVAPTLSHANNDTSDNKFLHLSVSTSKPQTTSLSQGGGSKARSMSLTFTPTTPKEAPPMTPLNETSSLMPESPLMSPLEATMSPSYSIIPGFQPAIDDVINEMSFDSNDGNDANHQDSRNEDKGHSSSDTNRIGRKVAPLVQVEMPNNKERMNLASEIENEHEAVPNLPPPPPPQQMEVSDRQTHRLNSESQIKETTPQSDIQIVKAAKNVPKFNVATSKGPFQAQSESKSDLYSNVQPEENIEKLDDSDLQTNKANLNVEAMISDAVNEAVKLEKKLSLLREQEAVRECTDEYEDREQKIIQKLKNDFEAKEKQWEIKCDNVQDDIQKWRRKYELNEKKLIELMFELKLEKEKNLQLCLKFDKLEKVKNNDEEKRDSSVLSHSHLNKQENSDMEHSLQSIPEQPSQPIVAESKQSQLGTNTESKAKRKKGPSWMGALFPPANNDVTVLPNTTVPLQPETSEASPSSPVSATQPLRGAVGLSPSKHTKGVPMSSPSATSPPPRHASPSVKHGKSSPPSVPPPPPRVCDIDVHPSISDRLPIEKSSPTAIRISKFSQHLKETNQRSEAGGGASSAKRDTSPISDRIAQWKQKAGGSIYGTGDIGPLQSGGGGSSDGANSSNQQGTEQTVRTVRNQSPMSAQVETLRQRSKASIETMRVENSSDKTSVLKQGAKGVPPPPPMPPPRSKPKTPARAASAPTRKQTSELDKVTTNVGELANSQSSKDSDVIKGVVNNTAAISRRTRASSVTTRHRSRSSTLIAQRLANWNSGSASTSAKKTPAFPNAPPLKAPTTPSSAVPGATSSTRSTSPRYSSPRHLTPHTPRSTPPSSRSSSPHLTRSSSPRSIVANSSSRFRSPQPSIPQVRQGPKPKWGGAMPPPPPPSSISINKTTLKEISQDTFSPSSSSTISSSFPESSILSALIPVPKDTTPITSPIKSRTIQKTPTTTTESPCNKNVSNNDMITPKNRSKVSPTTKSKPTSPALAQRPLLSVRVTQSHDSLIPNVSNYSLKGMSPGRNKTDMEKNIKLSILSPSGIAKSPHVSSPDFPNRTSLNNSLLSEFHASSPNKDLILCQLCSAAEAGSARDQFDLGFMLFEGSDYVDKNMTEAARWFRKAADQSMAEAQFNLGLMYDEGLGLPKSDAKAVAWYLYAADQEFAPAQFNLGVMYHLGRGVPQSDIEAARWWKQAAQLDDVDAMAGLGGMYRMGKGVNKSLSEAAAWYLKAAELNHPIAAAYLGCMHRYGSGVVKSDSEAAKWFAKASQLGHSGASAVLGLLYMDGKGVVRNGKSAWRSLTLACSTDSFGLPSLYYIDNEGLSKDLKKARDLCTLAAVQGNEQAKILLRTHFPADLML